MVKTIFINGVTKIGDKEIEIKKITVTTSGTSRIKNDIILELENDDFIKRATLFDSRDGFDINCWKDDENYCIKGCVLSSDELKGKCLDFYKI